MLNGSTVIDRDNIRPDVERLVGALADVAALEPRAVAATLEQLHILPAGARGAVPLLLNLSFTANSNVVDDPGIKPGEVWGRDGEDLLHRIIAAAFADREDSPDAHSGGASVKLRALPADPDRLKPCLIFRGFRLV